MPIENVVLFSVDAAVDSVGEAVVARVAVEVRAGKDHFAIGHEGDVNRVIHAGGDDGLKTSAVGAAAKDVGGFGGEILSVYFVCLFGECAFTPIDVAVGTGIWAMQVVGATGECSAFEPFFAFVGDTIAVGIGELPDTRRRGNVERAVEEERTFGEHHVVGEHSAFV